MSILSSLAGAAFSFGMATARPADAQTQSEVRYQLGWTDLARDRTLLYKNQIRSVVPARTPNDGVIIAGSFASENYQPTRFNAAQAIQMWNQLPWHLGWENGPQQREFQLWLGDQLRCNGIQIEPVDLTDLSPIDVQAATAHNAVSLGWRRYIDFTASAPPLDAVIAGYYRSQVLPDDQRLANEAELRYNFQRSQYRREEDRKQLLRPFFRWNALDAMKLFEGNEVNADTYAAMLNAAGFANPQDRSFLDKLADPLPVDVIVARYLRGQIDENEALWRLAKAGIVNAEHRAAILAMRFRPGNPGLLFTAATRDSWNEDFADRYGLDERLGDNAAFRYWIEAQGLSAHGAALPGPNPSPADWLKLEWRATRPLPNFGVSQQLLHRLRPEAVANPKSPVAGLQPWTMANVQEMLSAEGWTTPVAKALTALAYEPLNIRLINHVLSPYATHANVKQVADENLGHPTDWIEGAMLDHGFAPALAKVAAAGILAQADDRANAERLEHEKRQRQESRDQAQKEYASGALTFEQTVPLMTDEFFPANMAAAELLLIDRRQELAVVEVKIKALQSEFVSGKISAADATAYLATFLARPERIGQLLTEWTWERTEKMKMLETGGILSAVRTGLMLPAIALQRLVNLGWTQADALIELAQVEQALAAAQAKTLQAAATHQMAQANKLAAEHAKDAKAAAIQAAKETREHVQTQKAIDRASHEKLLAQSEYYARIHASNDAFAKADAKGNDQKKDAEIEKQLGAYQRYLLDQLKIIQQGPEVAHEVLPLDTRQISLPEPAPTNSGAPASNPEPTASTGSGGGGPGASGGPEGGA